MVTHELFSQPVTEWLFLLAVHLLIIFGTEWCHFLNFPSDHHEFPQQSSKSPYLGNLSQVNSRQVNFQNDFKNESKLSLFLKKFSSACLDIMKRALEQIIPGAQRFLWHLCSPRFTKLFEKWLKSRHFLSNYKVRFSQSRATLARDPPLGFWVKLSQNSCCGFFQWQLALRGMISPQTLLFGERKTSLVVCCVSNRRGVVPKREQEGKEKSLKRVTESGRGREEQEPTESALKWSGQEARNRPIKPYKWK